MAARTGRALPIAAILLGLTPVAGTAANDARGACPWMQQMPFQLRPSTCDLAQAVSQGTARSETFRRLVERVGALDGIVYLNAKHFVESDTGHVFEGTLQHRIMKAGDHRLLYVTIAPGRQDRVLAILAHELQHVIEVLEAGATTEAGIDALFKRIGVEASAWAYETGAAQQVQTSVARELAEHRR